jgi:predicted GIY-YIG superfamily endonuclease
MTLIDVDKLTESERANLAAAARDARPNAKHRAELAQLKARKTKARGPQQREAKATRVYLIRRDDRAIKVGISSDVQQRRLALTSACAQHLTILRTIKCEERSSAFAIETALKTLLRRCRMRGEWFSLEEYVAIVALHVAEHGDLEGCVAVREAILGETRKVREYAKQLLIEHPEYFRHAEPYTIDWINPKPIVEKPKSAKTTILSRPIVSIYPDDWTQARIAAAKQKTNSRPKTQTQGPKSCCSIGPFSELSEEEDREEWRRMGRDAVRLYDMRLRNGQ